jgi:protein-S-isoprenylcysteine O-methyltransferase Ste14
MGRAAESKPSSANGDRDPAVVRRMIQVVLQYVVIGLILFAAARTLAWGWAWAYLGVSLAVLTVNLSILPRELIAERGRRGENVKRWDKLLAGIGLLPTLAMPIIAGLDQRFGWSPTVGLAAHMAGLGAYAIGQAGFSWAMVSNPYFSTSVRIQRERGHQVARRGPYRFVRHPGYAAFIVFNLGGPPALGSVWAFVPVGVEICLIILRTVLEDRTLRTELEGYEAYASEVRYRLIPGVW